VIPGALDDVVLAMLAKDPAGRPTLAALCRVLDAPDAVRRRSVRWPFVALAAAALATAALLVIGRRDTLPADAAAPPPAPAAVVVTPPAAPVPVITPAPAPTPPPRQVAPPRATVAKQKPVAKKPALPPPPPAVVAEGKLQLFLRGARGTIAVDGRSYGVQSELALSLPGGVHRVTVRFPNETERSINVAVVAGEVTRREVTALYDGAPKGDELLNPNSLGGKR